MEWRDRRPQTRGEAAAFAQDVAHVIASGATVANRWWLLEQIVAESLLALGKNSGDDNECLTYVVHHAIKTAAKRRMSGPATSTDRAQSTML